MFQIYKTNQKLDREAKRRRYIRNYMSKYRSKLYSGKANPENAKAKLIRAKINFDRKQKNLETIKYDTVFINDGYEVLEYDLKYLTFDNFNEFKVNNEKDKSHEDVELNEKYLHCLKQTDMIEKEHNKLISFEEHLLHHDLKHESRLEDENEDEDEDEDEELNFDDNDSKGSYAFFKSEKVLFWYFGITFLSLISFIFNLFYIAFSRKGERKISRRCRF
jgi:hypothetical protein